MIKWLAIPNETKRNAYIQIAEQTGMSPFAVEKDWWVVQTLDIVFGMEVSKYLVFKGGTSLSKAWKLIKRFSEDIDLAIDREFLGFKGELSKNQRDKLRKKSGKYIEEVFISELIAKFEEKEFDSVKIELVPENESDKDRKINIYYPNVIESPGYLEPSVQIEISCRSLREPFTLQTFNSLVDEYYPDRDFSQAPIIVPTVNPERTFLEKLFLLHEEFHRTKENRRVDRLSLHLYDIVKISKTEFAEKAINDKTLYKNIVEHRYKFNRVGGVNYNLHQPQTLNPIPPLEIRKKWKEDYNIMIERMIYEENPPSFDTIISELTKLLAKINGLTWKLEKVYHTPNIILDNRSLKADEKNTLT